MRSPEEAVFEKNATTLNIEVETLINMIRAGILPACAKDMAKYTLMPALAIERESTYTGIKKETDKLKDLFDKKPHNLRREAAYLCDTVKPQMVAIRALEGEEAVGGKLVPLPDPESRPLQHEP